MTKGGFSASTLTYKKQIESHKMLFREKAKARTDHGADIVASTLPIFSGGTSPRRSTSVSESLGSVASLPPLPPPQAPLAGEISAPLPSQGL